MRSISKSASALMTCLALLAANSVGGEVVNELLITDLGVGGSITIFEYQGGDYQEIWSTVTTGVQVYQGGGEAGDLTGDGRNEIALVTVPTTSGSEISVLQIWAYDLGTQSWFLLWSATRVWPGFSIGDIVDVDNDGTNELLVTEEDGAGTTGRLVLYSYDGSGFSVEATVRDCSGSPRFIATAGDLDGDGTPEILFQCFEPEDLIVQEYDSDSGSYPVVGVVPLPPGLPTDTMIVDDMETGDVNGDGLVDAVFCGNSGRVHVVTFDTILGDYVLEFSSPPPVGPSAVSQTCSVGDVTNDGQDDILVLNDEGAKVYSHDGNTYQEIWVGDHPISDPPIGGSFIGDADNDGFTEFLFLDTPGHQARLYEDDVVGASNFQNTVSFSPLVTDPSKGIGATIIIADLNGTIIFADGLESGDTSAWARARGNVEVVQPGLARTAHALEVTVDGTAGKSFLLTKRPRRERRFKVSFYLKANAVDLSDGDVMILQLAGGGKRHVKLTLEQDGNRYWVNLFGRSNTGGFQLVGRTRVKRRRAVRLAVEWQRATGPGAANGLLRLVKGSRVRAERTDLYNHQLVVQALRVGLPGGSRGAVGGSFFLDEFLLTR